MTDQPEQCAACSTSIPDGEAQRVHRVPLALGGPADDLVTVHPACLPQWRASKYAGAHNLPLADVRREDT